MTRGSGDSGGPTPSAQAPAGPHQGLPLLRGGAPLERARAAMVLLHGRGASPEDILALGSEIATPELALLAPTAAGSTWYPYSFLSPLERNQPALESALAAVGETVATVGAAGIPATRTLLLGFSQGGCLALEFAARNARRYGGVAGLSAGLIGPPGTPLEFPGSLAGTPVFLGCDERDPHIPRERVEESTLALQKLGAEVTMRIYRGLGHSVNLEELQWVRGIAVRLSSG
jgi:phospholipase/carboxylesterase